MNAATPTPLEMKKSLIAAPTAAPVLRIWSGTDTDKDQDDSGHKLEVPVLEERHETLPLGHFFIFYRFGGFKFLEVVLRLLYTTDIRVVKLLIISYLSIPCAFILTHLAIVLLLGV